MIKRVLLASAPSKEMLIGLIAEYWYCDRDSIRLGDDGEVLARNGETVPCQNFTWKKKKGRYRFEALN